MKTLPLITLFGVLALGCAAHVDAVVKERPLPQAFPSADAVSEGPSSAALSWREWFANERLNGLIEEALQGNQDLLIAVQRIEMARASVTSTTGALLPTVDVTAGVGLRRFGLYTMDGAGNATTDIAPGQPVPLHLPDFGVGLQSVWEVDLWGRLRSQRQSAIAQYLATVEARTLVRTSLVAEVASGYYDLVMSDHTLEVLRRAVERQEQALAIVKLQKEAGRSTELAVQQFEAQLAETKALARAARQKVLESENRLNLLLGRYPTQLERDRDVLFAEPPRTLSAGVPSELLRNRPDVRQAELLVEASKFDLKAARAAFFPSLNLSATVGLQAFNPAYLVSIPESVAYSVLGGLIAPLVNRAAIEAQFEGAKANQLQAMYEYQRTVLSAYVEVVNALADVQNTEEILSHRRSQKAAVEGAIASADILYRAGKASYLEVLLAQQSALQAELDLLEAARQRRTALVSVYRALGGGVQ
ncbi:efflux transporter outer membrane subunit [Archangium lipolyticum]|uniref:efflux transporter outer membrane subunit n=1 Tax=Archangium lipolyticum TaxID=2970465 RepID=UPI00214A2658|nr:efflux transporter outer membrane subunit [Archangium lipolyticum]